MLHLGIIEHDDRAALVGTVCLVPSANTIYVHDYPALYVVCIHTVYAEVSKALFPLHDLLAEEKN